ncbi:hypothetical protein [Atopobium sp. oral taxon 416]|uniref:hypothetical protein n=1 Tax=Atopobium sp. oral taxon 416 TaxID=712157 RepID=UPI001BA81607|nr:hypothetical protein [Atopobium sp. oral taxon 416]QUC02062.1 hypothetical protein J4859_08290 [Atopobium sp. oral taxon 416]
MAGQQTRKPERQGRYLGADTFKLHGGHCCAIVIIDLKMGHVLWLVHSKGKEVVYAFCDHASKEWMFACGGHNLRHERRLRARLP